MASGVEQTINQLSTQRDIAVAQFEVERQCFNDFVEAVCILFGVAPDWIDTEDATDVLLNCYLKPIAEAVPFIRCDGCWEWVARDEHMCNGDSGVSR